MNHKKIDAISESLRLVYETAENNMVAEVNMRVARDSISTLARVRTLQQTLGKVKLETDDIVEKVLKRASDMEGISLVKLTEENRLKTTEMFGSAFTTYARSMNRVVSLRATKPLRESIFAETQRNISQGMKVTYANGRSIGYKEYMEMNTRTTVQREIGSSQLSSGGQAGVVFYITNHFADCADDHKAYQGKIYYDERWREFGYDIDTAKEIDKIIRSKNMLGVQRVRDDAPYLTTRPNCRHSFTPISIEQAGGRASGIVSDLKLSTGSYKDENYEDMQRQRYQERQIRFYKNRMEQNEKLGSVLGADIVADKVRADQLLIRKWQLAQRKLVEKNPVLSRDYRRETSKILLNDLGVRYNL